MTRRAVVLTTDPGTGELLALWLGRAGFEVVATARGGEAARALDDGGAELMVLDRVHPHWSGLGTIQAIKRRHPGIRVLVAGLRPDDPFLPLARAVGADAVVPAPLDRQRVMAYV
ncbi:MAG: response regulator [Pseudomonadota bacterium]